MRNSRSYRRFAVALLLAAGLGVLALSCGDDGSGQATQQTLPPMQGTSTPTGATVAQGPTSADGELLSTFKSKDPFIQQNIEEETTTTSTTSVVSPPTTSGGAPTTTYRPGVTTTTRYYPPSGNTTTTKPPATTTTTASHVHALKILSVGDLDGAAAVTFRVDNSIYKDKRVGDVVSSSWGQIKVVDLDSSSKVATLLHGSETLVLSVGQVVYE